VTALVEAFIRRFNVQEGKRVVSATPETLAMLQAYDWPGNVRQLENAVYRAIVLADGPYLTPHDFPAISGLAAPVPAAETSPSTLAAPTATEAQAAAIDSPVKFVDERGHLRTLEDIERDLIQFAIETYAGHMTEVARRLGIGRSTLYRKVREQGLEGVIDAATEAA
jgi:DNA-binding NtrC family response regulator